MGGRIGLIFTSIRGEISTAAWYSEWTLIAGRHCHEAGTPPGNLEHAAKVACLTRRAPIGGSPLPHRPALLEGGSESGSRVFLDEGRRPAAGQGSEVLAAHLGPRVGQTAGASKCRSSLFTLRQELADEACGIRLSGRIRQSVEKLRCAAWSNGVGAGEITAQVFHCLHRAREN